MLIIIYESLITVIKLIKFGWAVFYCNIHWCKKAGRSSEYYPVVSNTFPFHKCLASNSFQMQSNISSQISTRRHKINSEFHRKYLGQTFLFWKKREHHNKKSTFMNVYELTLKVSGMSLASGDGLADGLGHVVNVVGGDPAHRDPGGLQQVERPLLLKPHALVFCQAHI